jgi:hypothetical protein
MEVAVKSRTENKKRNAFKRFSQNRVVDLISSSAFAKDTRQLSAKVNLHIRKKQEQIVPNDYRITAYGNYSVYNNDYGISYGNYIEYGYGDA